MSVREYGVSHMIGVISASMIRCHRVCVSPSANTAVISPAVNTSRFTPFAAVAFASAATSSVAFRRRTVIGTATTASQPTSACISIASSDTTGAVVKVNPW
ncbi:MAG: hypothetical protein ACYSWQ_29895, partial [Planctomycetota bacterium]